MTAAAQVDELISDLVDGGKVARREAARSLALIGPEAKAAVPALARALDDDEVQVFFWSATALANLGQPPTRPRRNSSSDSAVADAVTAIRFGCGWSPP